MIESLTIPLSQNAFAKVDFEAFESLNKHKWCLRVISEHLRYAIRRENGKTIYMHRQILNTSAGMHTDHINGDGLDNRKSNLRICTPSQNLQNSMKQANKSSKFKGVCFRAYPNNPLYCGRLQSPMPALSAKNVLNVEKTTSPSIFGLPPWPRTFRSAS
ncbi:MAG: HNH endonuclease [Planctomycetes bacterium]|nr:HNH endonuclease [Planctomycetota bacterium]